MVVVVMGLMVKDTRILVVGPPKSWLRVPQKVMPRNPDKLAHANFRERSSARAGRLGDLIYLPRYLTRVSA